MGVKLLKMSRGRKRKNSERVSPVSRQNTTFLWTISCGIRFSLLEIEIFWHTHYFYFLAITKYPALLWLRVESNLWAIYTRVGFAKNVLLTFVFLLEDCCSSNCNVYFYHWKLEDNWYDKIYFSKGMSHILTLIPYIKGHLSNLGSMNYQFWHSTFEISLEDFHSTQVKTVGCLNIDVYLGCMYVCVCPRPPELLNTV